MMEPLPGDPRVALARIPVQTSTLGEGLMIHRALPTRLRRMVGAWCFLDHIGPRTFRDDEGLHVGAHPHTCLQTFTWMVEGELLHRDSLGTTQVIRPGQVNLMTAGRGIVHTEDAVHPGQSLHAAQLWIALPPAQADCEPAFAHHAVLPQWSMGTVTATLLVGAHEGHTAPTEVHSPLLGLDLHTVQDAACTVALNPAFEHGVLVLQGDAVIGTERFSQDEFAYLPPGATALPLRLTAGARLLLIGGEPWPQPIVMWWNFVGHSRDEIIRAQGDWESGAPRFGPVPGDGGRRLSAPPLPWRRSDPPAAP